jgi:hypothetical protein
VIHALVPFAAAQEFASLGDDRGVLAGRAGPAVTGAGDARIGERVHGALYLHRAALGCLEEEQARVAAAEGLAGGLDRNVAKLEERAPERVSLVLYEDQNNVPFPALLEATTVDLRGGRATGARL